MEEILEIVDEQDRVVGQESRERIHRDGLLHREVHVWIFNSRGDILFQRRSPTKDTFPNLLDASVGGHVDQGTDYETTASKELSEETGLSVRKEDLVFLGTIRRKSFDSVTGRVNNAIKKEFALRYDGDPSLLVVEEGKATSLEFWPYKKVVNATEEDKKQFLPLIFEPEVQAMFKEIQKLATQQS